MASLISSTDEDAQSGTTSNDWDPPAASRNDTVWTRSVIIKPTVKPVIASKALRRRLARGPHRGGLRTSSLELEILAEMNDSSDSGFVAELLLPHLLQHGRHIMSVSAFQLGMYQFILPGVGFIAFAMMGNGPDWLRLLSPLVLGDPLCSPELWPVMAAAFLEAYPDALFMQVSGGFARILSSLGLLVNSVGGETEIDLAAYTFSGHAKRGLRSAITSAVKAGVVVQEACCGGLGNSGEPAASGVRPPVASAAGGHQQAGSEDSTGGSAAAAAGGGGWQPLIAAEMQEVDAAWMKHKGPKAAHMWLLNRQPVFGPEFAVRKFVARDGNGKLLAFIFFDAVFEAGRLVGYYANVTRMRPGAHPGVLNLIIKTFIDSSVDTLRAFARPHCISNLLAALAAVTESGLRITWRALLGRLVAWQHSQGMYPFQSLAAAKAKYGGGLHDGHYEDCAVAYRQRFMAHSRRGVAASIMMFDVGKLLGLWQTPADASLGFVRRKVQLWAAAAGRQKGKGKVKGKGKDKG
eukprot:gene13086-13213_t